MAWPLSVMLANHGALPNILGWAQPFRVEHYLQARYLIGFCSHCFATLEINWAVAFTAIQKPLCPCLMSSKSWFLDKGSSPCLSAYFWLVALFYFIFVAKFHELVVSIKKTHNFFFLISNFWNNIKLQRKSLEST
jgi:hypothetical protein